MPGQSCRKGTLCRRAGVCSQLAAWERSYRRHWNTHMGGSDAFNLKGCSIERTSGGRLLPEHSAYSRAGVNIDAGQRATELMAQAVRSTYGPQVLAGIGAFGGMYALDSTVLSGSAALVASMDGVGTKTKVAARLGRWDTIGRDLVNHCVNDI